jgi:hypothetical protein
MPTSPTSRLWSTLLLVSLFVTAFHYLPTVRAQYNEADCVSCVESVSSDDYSSNFTKTYCEVGVIGSGIYQCVEFGSDLCSDNVDTTYDFGWSCDSDLSTGAATAFLGFALGLVILYYCCAAAVSLAIIGGIVACVYFCVRGSSNRQQQYAGAPPPMVQPGTLATATDKTTTMMTANGAVLPAQSGLANGMDTPYHQPSYDNSNNYKA